MDEVVVDVFEDLLAWVLCFLSSYGILFTRKDEIIGTVGIIF